MKEQPPPSRSAHGTALTWPARRTFARRDLGRNPRSLDAAPRRDDDAEPEICAGDEVWFNDAVQGGARVAAVVLAVHPGDTADAEPFYTVGVEGHPERQTIRARLSLRGASYSASQRGQPATQLPWRRLLVARLTEQLGDCAERDAIIATVAGSLRSTTADNYGRHLERFVRYCEAQPDRPCPLPATTFTVVRWLAGDVFRRAPGAKRDKVAASSLQPYLSAINTMHEDLGYEKPALGPLIRKFRKGKALEQADDGRDAVRVYLPPAVVERVLLWALALDLSAASRSQILIFRAAVSVVVTFVFFMRGHTGAALLDADVRRSAAGTSFTLQYEKGKRHQKEARAIPLPPTAIAGFDELLLKWEGYRGAVRPTDSYFRLPAVDGHKRRTFNSDQIDAWLRDTLGHLDAKAPDGETWSGHSLRKGAASGSYAVGVDILRICHMGGWSSARGAYIDYIDMSCPDDAAARRFFGWLLRGRLA